MSTINDLLAREAIALDVRVDDWRAAVNLAGELLEKSGRCDDRYTHAMIASVEDNGPYIVVAPGFAFAHARPSDAVKNTGFAWLRLAEPVEFGHSKNDPVTLVVALAATDATAHTKAMAELAGILGNKDTKAKLDVATSADEIKNILAAVPTAKSKASASPAPASAAHAPRAASSSSTESKGRILTVCGNGLGTSLFLKNTLEQVLDRWGWSPYISIEATDTISAKGKAQDADCIFTSGEIARALGDLGVPMRVIEDFTSQRELDTAMRDIYDVSA